MSLGLTNHHYVIVRPGTPCINDSSSLGARRRLGYDTTTNRRDYRDFNVICISQTP